MFSFIRPVLGDLRRVYMRLPTCNSIVPLESGGYEPTLLYWIITWLWRFHIAVVCQVFCQKNVCTKHTELSLKPPYPSEHLATTCLTKWSEISLSCVPEIALVRALPHGTWTHYNLFFLTYLVDQANSAHRADAGTDLQAKEMTYNATWSVSSG